MFTIRNMQTLHVVLKLASCLSRRPMLDSLVHTFNNEVNVDCGVGCNMRFIEAIAAVAFMTALTAIRHHHNRNIAC